MKFCGNTYDPNDKDAPMYTVVTLDQTQAEAWQSKLVWLKGKTIGEPQATETYTVAQLKAMHMVGVYSPDEEAQP